MNIAQELHTGTNLDELTHTLQDEYEQNLLGVMSQDLYTIRMDKSEGDAYDKVRSVPERQGLLAYGKLYQWFTEVSGLGLTEQTRKLIHPDPPKREEYLNEYIYNWCERLRRLEAHGES